MHQSDNKVSNTLIASPLGLQVNEADENRAHRDFDLGLQLYGSINHEQRDSLEFAKIVEGLGLRGLRRDDPRLRSFFEALELEDHIDTQAFKEALGDAGVLVQRAMSGSLVIPDFKEFCRELCRIYRETKNISTGKVADYIPQLARVSPEKYAVSVCTIDGQRYSIGDASESFCIQSVCKPINYCLALAECGEQIVHQHVGREPSGHSFNEITLDSKRRPHNPLINAGAIMCAALIKPEYNAADRFDHVLQFWKKMAGGHSPGFDNAVYLSEKETADRNFALAYFMRENGSFPENTNILDALDFYFQCCSIEMTTEAMAVVAATLAKSGSCPLTGEAVITQPDFVKNCLSLMHSCGMYDFSGEFAFSIGLPAKSGVGGGLMLIVPNVMGICIWSPPLDDLGNTVRGIEFSRRLVETYNFHHYDSMVSSTCNKKDPRNRKLQTKLDGVMALCWAAAQNDIIAAQELLTSELNVNAADYDGRTALHLAASEGHERMVKFLLSQGADPTLVDRWGATPSRDAEREGHTALTNLL